MMSKGLLFFMVLSNVVDVISTKLGFTKAAYLRFEIILMIDACILNGARVKNTRAKNGPNMGKCPQSILFVSLNLYIPDTPSNKSLSRHFRTIFFASVIEIGIFCK